MPASPHVDASLTAVPIEVAELLDDVRNPCAGALGVFLGVVRAESRADGAALVALEYTAYEEMAGADLTSIARGAAVEFSLLRVCVRHRLGRLTIGDTSVAIVASSAHRAACFAGCRAIIERLKQSTPIFKREIWADGSLSWTPGNADA